jgi:hypothetical protein
MVQQSHFWVHFFWVYWIEISMLKKFHL